MITRPMLAATLDHIEQIQLPCYVQDKEDGIRCYIKGSTPVSRTFKDIPNRWILSWIESAMLPDGMDGELITLDENDNPEPFNTIQSKVMTVRGHPKFEYRVFDLANENWTYRVRLQALTNWLELNQIRQWIKLVRTEWAETHTIVEQFESEAISRGKEGIIIRDPQGYYKSGRSTISEGALLKLKRFEDDEAIIMGYEELMHNCNEPTNDNFGLQERSSHLAGMFGGNKLGSLIVKSSKFEEFFKIGSGFTDAERHDIWKHKTELLGATVTYKYQKHGMKDKPRIPVFKGIRKD